MIDYAAGISGIVFVRGHVVTDGLEWLFLPVPGANAFVEALPDWQSLISP